MYPSEDEVEKCTAFDRVIVGCFLISAVLIGVYAVHQTTLLRHELTKVKMVQITLQNKIKELEQRQ